MLNTARLMQLFVQPHLTSEEIKAVEIEISVRQNKLSEMDSIFTKHRRVPDIKHKRLCHRTARVIGQTGHVDIRIRTRPCIMHTYSHSKSVRLSYLDSRCRMDNAKYLERVEKGG